MTSTKHAAVHATHLVLSCIDHRCTDDLVCSMPKMLGEDEPNARDRYDHFALPGASVGVTHPKTPAWRTVFWEQVDIALDLHRDIDTLFVVDHLRCGAYRKLVTEYDGLIDSAMRPYHHRYTLAFEREAQLRYPRLSVERWLLVPGKTDLVWSADRFADDGSVLRSVACGHAQKAARPGRR